MPLVYGKALHKALEVFYTFPKAERSIPKDFKEVSDVMAFWPEENRKNQAATHFLYAAIDAFITEGQPLATLPDTDKRSLPNGIWVLQEYFKTYLNDPYVTYVDDRGPFTERTGEHVIFEDAELRIMVFGTIDLVLKHEVNHNILPADHKTTSQVGTDFFNRLKPNHQYSGYVFIVQRVFQIMTEEFLVNGVEVKSKPKTPRGKGPSFTRQITRRTDEDMQEFADTVEFAVRAYLGWKRSNVWPMGHVSECASYGGCQFLEICSAPNALRENLIESKFTTPIKK